MTRAIEHHQTRSQRGFSLIDTMVTLSVMAIVASMATMQVSTVRKSLQGDGAMRLVMVQLNTAREMAMTQRRNMEVRFVGTNWIQIVRIDVPSGTTVLSNVAFEGNAQYALDSIVAGMADTPDGFGHSSAISFGLSPAIMFGPNGAFIGINGAPINGTVFLSVANLPESVRAVTVLGATGNVRGYRWNGVVWSRV